MIHFNVSSFLSLYHLTLVEIHGMDIKLESLNIFSVVVFDLKLSGEVLKSFLK